MPVTNECLGWDSLLEMLHNAGGAILDPLFATKFSTWFLRTKSRILAGLLVEP